jgi:hypothetical protein
LHPNALGDYRLAKTIQYQLLALPSNFMVKWLGCLNIPCSLLHNSYQQIALKRIDNQMINLFITPVQKLFISTGQISCKSYIQYIIFAAWVSIHSMKSYVETIFEILIHQKKSIVKYMNPNSELK